MKKVVVTGADGFVGSNTVKCLLENGIEVLALDRNDAPNNLENHPLLTYIKYDISNPAEMLEKIEMGKYDTCIHLAWAGSAGVARVDYNVQMQNALCTVECMKTIHELGCQRFVCAGSIMEKEVIKVINHQGSKPGMGYIYGMGKFMAHSMCKSVAAEIGIELIWPIITNAYGEGEISPRFVNTTLRKIINGEPLQFTAATQNYDFIHVDDVARAFYKVAKNGKPFYEYVIGSSNARTLKEFIIEMQQAVAPEVTPTFGDIPFTGENMPLSTFDTSDTERDCGFKAEITFAEGTRRTMEWLKAIKS